MSKRPTAHVRRSPTAPSSSNLTPGYAVIGDTAAAVMYTNRLLRNGITSPIEIITEGLDKTGTPEIEAIDFVARHTKRMLHYLMTEQVHIIPAEPDYYDESTHYTQEHQVFHYYVGSGPLGDFISAYHLPRNGPWYMAGTNARMERFLYDHSMRSGLNEVEDTIARGLAVDWNLKLTSSIVVTEPSMLNCHHEFLREANDQLYREIGLDVYGTVDRAAQVKITPEAGVLQFTPGSSSGLYNIGGSRLELRDVRLVWKTNQYTYLRLATLGGLHPAPIQISTFYRAVLTIPLFGNHGDVDLSILEPGQDLLTTHLAFSLHDLEGSKQSGLVWLGQCYTTAEDLAIVDQNGKYADTGHCLLIVEAVCTKNKRQASYHPGEREIQINLNSPEIEATYLRKFSTIVSDIYARYTGTPIPVDFLTQNISICGAGICHDGNSISNYATRESPMVSLLELTTHLYGSELYATAGK